MLVATGPHPVQVDVEQTPVQVLIGLDCRCVVAVFLEGAPVPLALVVFLCDASGDQLHALGDHLRLRALY